MKPPRALMVLFWVVMVAAPTAATAIVATQFPAGVEVPLHWNFAGEIDEWGSAWAMLPAGLIMSGCNVLLALSYHFSDKLYNMGLVHGVSREHTRPFLCGTAVFLVLVMVGILIYWVVKAQPYMA